MISVLTQRATKYSQRWINRKTKDRWKRDIYYFAYGANIDEESCRNKGIFPIDSATAILKDHDIGITLPCEYSGKGYASIFQSNGKNVYGKLHRISYLELLMFDILEWVPFGFHTRIKVKAHCDDKITMAWAYFAKNPKQNLKTSVRYREILVNSAKKYKFPGDYVSRLASLPTGDNFQLDPSFRMSNPSKERFASNRLRLLYLLHDKLREKLCARLP